MSVENLRQAKPKPYERLLPSQQGYISGRSLEPDALHFDFFPIPPYYQRLYNKPQKQKMLVGVHSCTCQMQGLHSMMHPLMSQMQKSVELAQVVVVPYFNDFNFLVTTLTQFIKIQPPTVIVKKNITPTNNLFSVPSLLSSLNFSILPYIYFFILWGMQIFMDNFYLEFNFYPISNTSPCKYIIYRLILYFCFHMEIKFENLDVEADIFGEGFPVENMDQPEKFIPRYQNNMNDETSCVEDCSVCCGNICICFAYPFACCCCKCSCVHELPTSNVGIVEEFGKFKRLLKPGFNMINPCTEEVAEVDMRIKLLDAGQHSTITKDNVKVVIKASLAYRITNPIISYYVLRQSLNKALIQLCTASLRTVVGSQILDEVLTNRSKIAGGAKAEVMRNIPPGIQVDRIFMEQIIIPPQTEKDLTSAARQRRISEANIINSKADVETASLMKQSAELLDTKAAMQIRYLEMVQELGERGVVLMMEIGARKKGYKN